MTYNPNQPIQTAAPQAPTGGHRLSYDDRPGTLAKIAFSNALLLIPTLGFYRFWAKTKLRRHFWSSVKLDGESFEYTGTPKELLIGFFVALIVFLPMILIMTGVSFLAASDPDFRIVFGITYFIFITLFSFLSFYAFFAARRYRMSRTVFRGIRGAMTGKPSAYALRSMIMILLSALTLGIASPYAEIPVTRYLVKNSRFGNQDFDCPSLHGGPLMWRWVITWMSIVLCVGLFIYVDRHMPKSPADPTPITLETTLVLLSLFPSMIISLILYAWYAAFRFRYITSTITYGTTFFASGIKARSIIWIVFRFYLLMIGVFMLGSLIAFLFKIAGITHPEVPTYIPNIVLSLVLLWIAIVIFLTLTPILIYRSLLKRFVQSFAITGKIDFTQIAQAARGPKRGEGLADVLDVGGL